MLPAFKKLRLSRAESRDQQRWMPKPWYELRWENHWRPEKSWDEPRRGEPGWDQMRWDEMSRDELRETTSTCSFWRRSLRTLRFHSLNLTCSLWRDLDLARKYCFSTTLTCSFWRRSCAKASFSQPQTYSLWSKSPTKASFLQLQLQLAVFEGDLAWSVCFRNFNVQLLTKISHESFVFTTSTCRKCEGKRNQEQEMPRVKRRWEELGRAEKSN